MLRINELKLPVSHEPEDIRKKAAAMLKVNPDSITEITVIRRSLDARRKPELFFNYIVDVSLKEAAMKKVKLKPPQIQIHNETPYVFPDSGNQRLKYRPVIVGSGPAGLFCGLMLAYRGYCPLLIERGDDVDTRIKKVNSFWQGGCLDTDSNVQFGEGGAGTFSDGKLQTLLHDPEGRNMTVLKTFVHFGADESILYESKPHIGTDALTSVVKNMRAAIIKFGGEVRFGCRMSGLLCEEGHITGISAENVNTGEKYDIPAEVVILAVGHSARDTFTTLLGQSVPMEPKAFAVGLRVEHSQEMINLLQYGMKDPGTLGPASYKLTARSHENRGVYTFCMCPGGFVVNASSEPERLAVNGMSLKDRAGINANSAVVVTVNPQDFAGGSILGGMEFQRELERCAYRAGNGKIPVQLFEDFKNNQKSRTLGAICPQTKGSWEFSNLREVLPDNLSMAVIEGMEAFGEKIDGFDRPDAVFSGVESRTSSPLRILRNKNFESSISGLFPCGEGAGYAGGITSAAIDGIRLAEEIACRYAPCENGL